jgi:LysM repeat protein
MGNASDRRSTSTSSAASATAGRTGDANAGAASAALRGMDYEAGRDSLRPQRPLSTTAPGPTTYKVAPGDTLSKIAARFLSDPGRWREIWRANPLAIPDPNALQVGVVIQIPDGGAAAARATHPEMPAAPEGDEGMAPDGAQAKGTTQTEQKMARIYNGKAKVVQAQASALGIETGVAAAVLAVESSGGAHSDGKLTIRFEKHIFKNRAGKSVYVRHTGAQSNEYDALMRAIEIDEKAAYESISMGAPQIMGFNAPTLGYGSAKEMFMEFQRSERAQVVGMLEFIRNNRLLLKAARAKDWARFAKYYNGPDYADNAYDTKLKQAYEAWNKVTKGLPYR